jgi:hypothetical protein
MQGGYMANKVQKIASMWISSVFTLVTSFLIGSSVFTTSVNAESGSSSKSCYCLDSSDKAVSGSGTCGGMAESVCKGNCGKVTSKDANGKPTGYEGSCKWKEATFK